MFFGVTDHGRIIAVDLGRNTLENFANKLRDHTDPPLSPSIEHLVLEGQVIVAATVQRVGEGQLFYAFKTPYIRVGKTNQLMSPEEQRRRLASGVTDWSQERDRPTFEVIGKSLTRTQTEFGPSWRIRQASGDYAANLQWRFRGPHFQTEWQPTAGYALDKTRIAGAFDLTATPKDDDLVEPDEMAIELRFYWRGRWRHELHRWPLIREEVPTKVLWDLGLEVLPPLYFDE